MRTVGDLLLTCHYLPRTHSALAHKFTAKAEIKTAPELLKKTTQNVK